MSKLRWAKWRAIKFGIVAIFAGMVFFGIAGNPAIGQSPPSRATIALDGQPLFQIGNAGSYTATDRANTINLRLKEAAQSNHPFQVKIEQRNQLPTLSIDGRYLLTVTVSDVLAGSTPDEQAAIWAQQIQEAVDRAQAERRPDYVNRTAFQVVGIVALGMLCHWLLGWFQRQLSRSLQRKLTLTTAEMVDSQSTRPIESFLQLLLAIARSVLWAIVVLYTTNLFPLTRHWSYQITNILISSFTSPILTLGKNSYSVIQLLILVGLLTGLFVFATAMTNLLRSRLLSLAGISRGGQEAIATLAKYSTIVVGTLVLLQIWGLDISSLAILASALSVGIGFGLQDIAKNFGSGLVLVLERPIKVGDFIEVGNFKGTVERIGGRSTEILTLDRVSIVVPNSRFLAEEVINWTHGNPVSRLHVPVGVSYNADPRTVEAILLAAARSHPQVLEEPPPQVLFKGFGDSAINFDLLIWTDLPHQQFVLTSDLYFRIFAILKEQNIEIPFPQRDLHLRSGTLQCSAAGENIGNNE
jgi:small-conductance mechanosensitive channel